MDNQRNYTIDSFRLICTFLVITLHYPLPGFLGDVEHNLARIAVPFFFMTSGYFIYDCKRNICEKKILNQIKNISKLSFGGLAFYMLFNLILGLQTGNTISGYVESVFSLKNVFMAIILNKSTVCVILWFMYSLLYATILMFFINKFNLYKIAYFMIPLLMTLNLLLGCYSKITIGKTIAPEYIRNAWLTGIPYYLIGLFIRTHKIPIINKYLHILIIVILCFANVLETIIIAKFRLYSYSENFVCTILLSVTLFAYAVNNPGNKNIISEYGKKYSFYIYVLQMAIGGLLLGINPSIRCISIYIFIIGLLISVLYIQIKQKMRRLLWENTHT